MSSSQSLLHRALASVRDTIGDAAAALDGARLADTVREGVGQLSTSGLHDAGGGVARVAGRMLRKRTRPATDAVDEDDEFVLFGQRLPWLMSHYMWPFIFSALFMSALLSGLTIARARAAQGRRPVYFHPLAVCEAITSIAAGILLWMGFWDLLDGYLVPAEWWAKLFMIAAGARPRRLHQPAPALSAAAVRGGAGAPHPLPHLTAAPPHSLPRCAAEVGSHYSRPARCTTRATSRRRGRRSATRPSVRSTPLPNLPPPPSPALPPLWRAGGAAEGRRRGSGGEAAERRRESRPPALAATAGLNQFREPESPRHAVDIELQAPRRSAAATTRLGGASASATLYHKRPPTLPPPPPPASRSRRSARRPPHCSPRLLALLRRRRPSLPRRRPSTGESPLSATWPSPT